MPDIHVPDNRDTWPQVDVQFDDFPTAEQLATERLAPIMTAATEPGYITRWWFIRKAPCWRLRYQPTNPTTASVARTFIHYACDELLATGHIKQWTETIYEPEQHAFGGPTGMDIAHGLFHQDSEHILSYLNKPLADKRRELSILLCTALMRGAGQEWYEQGDVWARLAENRPLPQGTTAERIRRTGTSLGQLLRADTSPDSELNIPGGSLNLVPWMTAFSTTGETLARTARAGDLTRGLRAVLTHHVIFHWNRIGLPAAIQSVIAHAAREAVFGRPPN